MQGDEAATQLLERPGGRVAYDVVGDGALVVCVPGMGELRSSYRYTAPALTEAGLRVATMDLRGHGDSDAAFERYDDVAVGEDVIALIAESGGPAVVIGNSMGAAGAVWAAAERPDDVSGLVLLGPFVRNAPNNPLTLWMFKVLMSAPWAAKMWTSYMPRLYPGHRPADFEEHRAEIAASMRRPGHRKAFTATTRTSHEPAEARLDDVRAPVLVVMGSSDPDFRDPAAEARWIGERLPGDVVMVPDAGHYPQVEDPAFVNQRLVEFCQRARRADTA